MLRPKLNRVWTSNNANLRRDPGDAKYLQGWVSEIPTFQVLNYLQYKVDTTLLALAERGVFEWGTDVQYGLGSLVWDDATKTVYVATVGSPSRTLRPSENLGQWAASAIQVSRYDYDDIVSKISAHIADITSNPHRLTANMIGAYNKAQIDSLIAQYNALVASHANDRDNPHKVTAAQAGAVPIIGGTYTGPVTFQQGMLFNASGTTKLSFGPAGFYMQSGDTRIGLDASGVPVVGKASTNINSRIITDAIFAEVKAREEPKYAVPLPVYALHLVGDINVYVGTGSTDDPSPAFNPSAGNCYFYNPTEEKYLRSDVDVNNTGKVTVAVDLMSPDPRDASSSAESVYFGTENILIVGTDYGKYGIKLKNAGNFAMTQLSGPVNTWYRFAITYDGATAIIYINGVEVGRQAATFSTSGTNRALLHFLAKTSPILRRWNVRNFRIWDTALSAKQISTL